MLIKEAIKILLKDNNKTQTWLSDRMGYNKPTAIANMLSRGNLTLDTLFTICEILGYEVTIQPKHRTGPRPRGQIVLEGELKEGVRLG